MATDMVTKPFLDGNGLPVTHGELVQYSFVALDKDCELALEFHGWPEIDGAGNSTVAWSGTPHQREVFCPVHGGISSVPTAFALKRKAAVREPDPF